MQIETYTRRSLHKMLRSVYEAATLDEQLAKDLAENDMGMIEQRVDGYRQSLWLVFIGSPDVATPNRVGYYACVFMGDGLGRGTSVETAKDYISPHVRGYSKLYYLVTNAKPSHKDIYKEAARAASLDGVIFWASRG